MSGLLDRLLRRTENRNTDAQAAFLQLANDVAAGRHVDEDAAELVLDEAEKTLQDLHERVAKLRRFDELKRAAADLEQRRAASEAATKAAQHADDHFNDRVAQLRRDADALHAAAARARDELRAAQDRDRERVRLGVELGDVGAVAERDQQRAKRDAGRRAVRLRSELDALSIESRRLSKLLPEQAEDFADERERVDDEIAKRRAELQVAEAAAAGGGR